MLSEKARDGELKVLEELKLDVPRTKEIVRILTVLGVNSSALIVTGEPESGVVKSARNLPEIKTLPAGLLNVVDILSYRMLLMTEAAVRKAEELWGEGSSGGNGASLRGFTPPSDN
jgi:large subunit ribosomal protein L4